MSPRSTGGRLSGASSKFISLIFTMAWVSDHPGEQAHKRGQGNTGSPGADRKLAERSSIVHTSLYLPEPVYEALRKIAFEERLKIHDVVLEGIDIALRRRGSPSIEGLKVGKKR
jgi:hypothetical protein